MSNTQTQDREIVITRLVSAPRALVFEAWTQPEHVINWWGPNGFTNTIHEMEVKPGGIWRFTMHGPDGTNFPNRIVFQEVEKPSRLVYAHDDDKESGKSEIAFHVTVTFEEQGDKTLITMRTLFRTAVERDRVVKEFGAIEGGNQTLTKLEIYLQQQAQRIGG